MYPVEKLGRSKSWQKRMAAKPLPLSELHTEQSGSEADTGTTLLSELQSPLKSSGVCPLLDGIILAWMGHFTSNPVLVNTYCKGY